MRELRNGEVKTQNLNSDILDSNIGLSGMCVTLWVFTQKLDNTYRT